MRNQILFVCIFFLTSVLPLNFLFGQQWRVNDLILTMESEGFEFNELEKIKMARLLKDHKVIDCQVKQWKFSADEKKITKEKKKDFLLEEVVKFNDRQQLVRQKLKPIIGDSDLTERLARQIARDNTTSEINNDVLPKLLSVVSQNHGRSIDEKRQLAANKYRSDFDPICKKVNKLKKQLESYSSARTTTRKQPLGNAKSVLQNNTSTANNKPIRPSIIHPDRMITDKRFLCSSSVMIRKCYDYTPLEEINGRIQRGFYHGNLYEDCDGYILVLHNKTVGQPAGNSYYPQPGQQFYPN